MEKAPGLGLVYCKIRMVSFKDNIVQVSVSTKTMGTVDCTSLYRREESNFGPGMLRWGPVGERGR